MTRTLRHLPLFVVLLTAFFFNPRPTLAIGYPDSGFSGSTFPSFTSFRKAVQNGEADTLRGVYVPSVLAMPIVQQPAADSYYVSEHDGELTEFSVASRYGNIGLLAHNKLSGKFFSQLKVGQEVRLVRGDGKVEYFVITQVLRFQALQPASISSSFRNLDRNETLSAGEMFNRAYVGEYHLVFQTCIEAQGNASWGRLFVVALPKR